MTIDAVRYLNSKSVNGLNLYAYCGNNPVNKHDPSGRFLQWINNVCDFVVTTVSSIINTINNMVVSLVESNPIRHNVPIYNQGSAPLCWAYCEIMIQDYEASVIRSEDEVRTEAENISKGRNDGQIIPDSPEDLCIKFRPRNIYDIYFTMLFDGEPIYAFYRIPGTTKGEDAHYIVVTGVDVKNNIVYTNNPEGVRGAQTFEEFIDDVATNPAGINTKMDLYWISASGGIFNWKN